MLGAVCTAEDAAIVLDAVAHDANAAMGARGRERGDRALKAVEDVSFAAHSDLEGFVIVVAALRAFAHDVLLPSMSFLVSRTALSEQIGLSRAGVCTENLIRI
jgi:hypothetical protein